MYIYTATLIWSVLLFGAVHTYAYTFMNIAILIETCRYSIQKNNHALALVIPKTTINYLFIAFALFILFYILPLPQSWIQILSPESARINQLAQSPMQVVDQLPIQWGTIAVSDFPVRNAWVQYMIYVLFFWGLIHALNQPKYVKQLCILLIGIGVLESLYGIFQTFVDPGYILWVPKAYFRNKRDTCGTFINRNHFAALMIMLMLLSIAYSASQADQKSANNRKSLKRRLSHFFTHEYQWNQKIMGLTAATIMGLGLFFSASRGAVIAVLPGAIILMVALYSRRTTRKQGILIILVGIIIVGYTVFIGEDRLVLRFNAIERAMTDRFRYVEATIDLIHDYPILGVGLSNFEHAFPKYQSIIDRQVTVTHAHNDWLQLYAEMGILGILGALGILFLFIRIIIHRFRMRHSPMALCLGTVSIAVLISMSVHSLYDFPMHIPGNALIMIAICAVGFQAMHLIKHNKRDKSLLAFDIIPLSVKNIPIWLLFWGTMFTLFFVTTRHFIAETYCNTVPNTTLYRNQNPQIGAIQKAILWDSSNPVYWYKLAWQHIAYRNTLSESENAKEWIAVQEKILYALEQAVAKNPCYAEYHIRLGWEYHRLHFHEKAEQRQKRVAASNISIKRAASVCGVKDYHQHMEIANFWNMRSATHQKLSKQKQYWKIAVSHYRQVLIQCPKQRCKKTIIYQLQLFHRDESEYADIFD